MDHIVKKGSKVKFFFSDGTSTFGEILSAPTDIGDVYIIQSFYEGKKDLIEYIQTFNRMVLFKD